MYFEIIRKLCYYIAMQPTTISDKFSHISDTWIEGSGRKGAVWGSNPPQKDLWLFASILTYRDESLLKDVSQAPTISLTEIGNNDTFRKYIFDTIYFGTKLNGKPIKTLSQAYYLNTFLILFGISFMSILLFAWWSWLMHFLGWVLVFVCWLFMALKLRFYKYLIRYFEKKDELISLSEAFQNEVSEDTIDPTVLPMQVEYISKLILDLTETSHYLDKSLDKLRWSSIYFSKQTLEKIEFFLEKEIIHFRQFLQFTLTFIQKWLDWHKEELNTEYTKIQLQIEALQQNNPELAIPLDITSTRLNNHIQNIDTVLVKV